MGKFLNSVVVFFTMNMKRYDFDKVKKFEFPSIPTTVYISTRQKKKKPFLL